MQNYPVGNELKLHYSIHLSIYNDYAKLGSGVGVGVMILIFVKDHSLVINQTHCIQC